MNKFISMLNNSLTKPASIRDVLVLVIFSILITVHPYYMNDRINTFELGLYLPGINAILHGLVPYKDFFHLRGPLELYIPALLMKFFGTHMQVLCSYFFFGNVLCLIFLVLIAKELVRSRYMFYMMIPVIIARAYPRVCFWIWGGMRYAMGLIVIYCLIKFLKNKKTLWIVLAGFSSAIAGLISIEMAAYATAAVIACMIAGLFTRLLSKEEVARGMISYIGAGILGVLPWALYALSQNALTPYIDSFWTIVTRMQVVIDPHLVSIYPHNFSEALAAMLNPVSVNFKHMTPAYLYVFLLGYLIFRFIKKQWQIVDLCLLSLGIYGFIMYNTGFRGLWAAQFEMALMPEKLLYFFLVEVGILWLWSKRDGLAVWMKNAICILIVVMFLGSCIYSITRYNHRFWAFQYLTSSFSHKKKEALKFKDKNEHYSQLTIDRVRDVWVPNDQYLDLSELDLFIRQNTSLDDKIVMFPELGIYNYFYDRPFVGRFPITTFSWFNERWFKEYFDELKEKKATYIIVQKKMPQDWIDVYLGYAPSKEKYIQIMDFIHKNYQLIAQTQATDIYRRKR